MIDHFTPLAQIKRFDSIVQMKEKAAALKAFIVISALIIFLAINSNNSKQRSNTQQSFDTWTKQVRIAIESAETSEDPTKRPAVRMQLVSTYPEMPANWTFTSSGKDEEERKLLRLLDLASNANLFSLPALDAKAEEQITLSIEANTYRFSQKFTLAAVKENVAAQSFLKLFEFYSKQNTTPTLSKQ